MTPDFKLGFCFEMLKVFRTVSLNLRKSFNKARP